VEEAVGGEDRQPDEAVVAMGERHHERGHRHLADVEIAEFELAPEDF
jgi:hypothetical protein